MSRIEQALTREAVEATPRRSVPVSWQLSALTAQGFRCVHCEAMFTGLKAVKAEFDHVLPLALGGEHAEANIEAVCAPCHREKTREDVRRIRKAQRLERDANPETRRQPPHRLRSRGFQKADDLK